MLIIRVHASEGSVWISPTQVQIGVLAFRSLPQDFLGSEVRSIMNQLLAYRVVSIENLSVAHDMSG